MFEEQYENLRVAEKEDFSHCVNTLMLKSFILRDYYDRNAKMMRSSKEYSFIDRNFDLVSEYLQYSGWILNKDSRRGVISISNEYQENHLRLDLVTSLIVYGLRYVYENQRNEESLTQEVFFTSAELVQTMMNLHLFRPDKRPSFASLGSCFRFLDSHNIISRISGDFKERNLQFYIMPSILFVIDNEMISSIYESIETLPDDEDVETR